MIASPTPLSTPLATSIDTSSSLPTNENNNSQSIFDTIDGVINGANTTIINDVTTSTNNLPQPLNHQLSEAYQSMDQNSFVQTLINGSKITAASVGVVILLPRLFSIVWPKIVDLPIDTQRRLALFPLIFIKRKKEKNWGIVYDSVTKQPVDPAVVSLYKVDSKDSQSSLTVANKILNTYGNERSNNG